MAISDEPFEVPVLASNAAFQGRVVTVTQETFMFAGQRVVREVVRHPGSVGVVALRATGQGIEVLLVRQYRHPVAAQLWELPAGLRDVQDESAVDCARRELREETGHEAGQLEPLLTCAPSPGGSDEVIQIFLTWNPQPVVDNYRAVEPEEQDMLASWVTLEEAVSAVLSGQVHNLATVAALLAVAHRAQGSNSGHATSD